MNLNPFSKKKKEKFDITTVRSMVEKPSGDIEITQIVHAKVKEVGDETKDDFSYKYTFTNPITNEVCEGTDILQEIMVGEQLFDVDDDVDIFFVSHGADGTNFEVNRQMVFPEINQKKKKFSIIAKILYTLFLIIGFFVCCMYTTLSMKDAAVSNESSTEISIEEDSSTEDTTNSEE